MKKIKKDKSISLLFFCFFSLITINIFSQNPTFFKIGIVNDKYNYIKVHKEENGEIITKIIKGEYFFYKEQKGNWWLVKTLGGSQGIQGYVFKDSISKIDSRELLSVGIGANGGNNPDFLKDTIISYKSIEKNEDYRLGFLFKYNYPEIKRTIIRENNATFNQNGIIVKVITKKVNKDDYCTIKDKNGISYIVTNENVYGFDGIDRDVYEEINNIYIFIKGNGYHLSKSSFKYLFQPTLNEVKVFKKEDNQLIIKIPGGDGGESYEAIFIVNDEKLIKKYIYRNF